LAGSLCHSVDKARKNKEAEADISLMFCIDLTASRDRRYTMEQIHEHISKIFTIVEETKDTRYVTLNVG
jgi:hypothetical protein